MKNKKILILKNDRAGDFISSVRLISELENDNKIKIYLSELNYNYKFLIPNCNYKKINLNLNIFDKIKIFMDILTNDYDKVFILSPKNFYFFLPLIFKKIKFYAIVINGKKRNRPSLFLRKYLYKISIRYRTKINNENIIQSNLSLINSNNEFNLTSLNLDKKPLFFSHLSNDYIYFQFKKNFFEYLNWDIKEFNDIINLLATKYNQVVFSADIEKNKYDTYFYKNFTSIDYENNFAYTKKNERNIIYLKKIDPYNLFLIINLFNVVI